MYSPEGMGGGGGRWVVVCEREEAAASLVNVLKRFPLLSLLVPVVFSHG